MTSLERFHAIRNADPGQDLAELLDVSALIFGRDGITYHGETVSYPSVRAALEPDPPTTARIKIEDL